LASLNEGVLVMTPTGFSSSASVPSISRRLLLGSTVAAAAAWPFGGSSRVSGQEVVPDDPATWGTWVLRSADELRPAAPADPTPAEIAEVLEMQAALTDDDAAVMRHWTLRPAVLPWTDIASAAMDEFLSVIHMYRGNGIVQAAMYDAVIAAYDAQDAYGRPTPSAVDTSIVPLEDLDVSRPAYPSAEAAVAGAAAAVLTALLPDAEPGRFDALADEATTSLLQAGVAFRSDIDAGLALGREIGERAIALSADDQPASAWDGSGRLTGPGTWEPTPPAFVDPPLEPLASTWRTWALTSGDEFRPSPPPAYGTPAYESQVGAVQEAVAGRTMAQIRAANFWQSAAASTVWDEFAMDLISRNGLDLPHAAQALTLMSIALADAEVAAWDGKYAYWTARPITVVPDLDVLFPTPPFPSYPSAHAAVSNAVAVVLAHLFPDEELDLLELASEAADSRAWGGIHFPIDNDAGQLLGRCVGYRVLEEARARGAIG
jgi:membrane-associated phospholipid phosphatase